MRLLPCLALVSALLASACSDDTSDDPTEVVLGETTLIVVVNPRVNTLNSASLTAPGSRRDGVTVSIEDGPSAIRERRGRATGPPRDGLLTVRTCTSPAGTARTWGCSGR